MHRCMGSDAGDLDGHLAFREPSLMLSSNYSADSSSSRVADLIANSDCQTFANVVQQPVGTDTPGGRASRSFSEAATSMSWGSCQTALRPRH